MAQALRVEFRRPLNLLARFGGEEFLGLWYDIEPQSLNRLSCAVRDTVAAMAIPHRGSPYKTLTATCGAIAFQPRGDESLLELIRQVDTELYQAKADGRNRVRTRVCTAATAA